jgi:hypothetical protein
MTSVREQIEAKLAEAEAVALTVTTPYPISSDFAPMRVQTRPHAEPGSHDGPVVGLAANPAAVLAWVAGIRAVVEMHRFDGDWCVMCHWCDERGCPTIRAIAAIWDLA